MSSFQIALIESWNIPKGCAVFFFALCRNWPVAQDQNLHVTDFSITYHFKWETSIKKQNQTKEKTSTKLLGILMCLVQL